MPCLTCCSVTWHRRIWLHSLPLSTLCVLPFANNCNIQAFTHAYPWMDNSCQVAYCTRELFHWPEGMLPADLARGTSCVASDLRHVNTAHTVKETDSAQQSLVVHELYTLCCFQAAFLAVLCLCKWWALPLESCLDPTWTLRILVLWVILHLATCLWKSLESNNFRQIIINHPAFPRLREREQAETRLCLKTWAETGLCHWPITIRGHCQLLSVAPRNDATGLSSMEERWGQWLNSAAETFRSTSWNWCHSTDLGEERPKMLKWEMRRVA